MLRLTRSSLYSERIRDEIRAGRTIPVGSESLVDSASRTILASKASEPVGCCGAVRGVGSVGEGFRVHSGLTAIAEPCGRAPVSPTRC